MKKTKQNLWWRFGSIVIVGIVADFIGTILYSFALRNGEDPFNASLSDYIGAILLFGIILEFLRSINRRLDKRISWAMNPKKRFLAQLGINLPATIILINILIHPFMFFFVEDDDWILFHITGLWEFIANEIAFLNAFIGSFVMFVILWEMASYFIKEWRNSLIELERYKKENIESRFEALKTQVNPHFLFNSLNTLSSLIHINQDDASKFVRQLSKVYRYILENRDKEIISLETELRIIESYIFLVETRFANNLQFKITVDEESKQKEIPPLALQMLIENAIKHNVVSRSKPLLIEIFVEEEFLVVKNNLQRKSSTEFSSKIGLKNIMSRYNYLSEKQVKLKESESTFEVRIPLLSK